MGFLLIFSCSDMGQNPDDTTPCNYDACGVCDGNNSTCVNYFTEIQPIFNANCTNCHGNSGGLDLSSHENIMAGGDSGNVVIPFNHANSLLWQKINSGLMPPFDAGLSTEEINLIETWINEGAKDN